MDSKSLVFLGLVSGPRQYRIPSFQRPYSWEKEDRETLWLDLLTQYEVLGKVWDLGEAEQEVALKSVSTHYLGTIVLSGPSSLGVPKSDVIDGQQRITTLLLAVCALRDHWGSLIAKKNGADEASTKRKSISNTYLLNDGHTGSDRYRVLPQSTDEKAFRAIVDFSGSGKFAAESLGLEPGDSSRMLNAYNFFRTEMGRQKVPDTNIQLKRFAHLFPLDPVKLEQAIAHRLSVIAIETKNNDDTNAIFESLNAKGRPLTQLDLLRNYIFMTIGSNADQVLKDEWMPIEKTHLPDRRDMEAFVWAEVVSRGTNVLQKRTYRTVQSELREAGGTAMAAENYVKRLKRRAPLFAQIVQPEKASNHKLRKALDGLSRAGGKTARPMVLWLFEQEHEERCTIDDVIACITHLESFVVRRFLCGLPPNNLNSMLGIMLSRLNNTTGPLGPQAGTVEQRLIAALLSVPKDWPDDTTLMEGIKDHDFYHNGDTRQRMHVLRSIDLSYGYDLLPGYEESDKSIEHILIQASAQKDAAAPWVSDLTALGQNFSAIQDRWLHTLGNLTLIAPADNSSLGSSRFAHKAMVYKTLSYKMTKDVGELGTIVAGDVLWGGDEIEARAEELAARCSTIWPRPGHAPFTLDTTNDDSLPEYDAGVDEEELVPFSSSISEEDMEP